MMLYTLDSSCLERARRALSRGSHPLSAALEQLRVDADRICRTPPESVVMKLAAAPGGDAHDYYSLAPDAWPSLLRGDKPCWQRREGMLNPDAESDTFDAARLTRMANRCLTLGAAWYFTRQRVYAQAAAEQIRCWFIDRETRMRPHLNFGHAVPGELVGQGSGLSETQPLWMVMDTLGLIANSGVLDDEDVGALRQWFAAFSHWMFHTDIGFEGYAWHDWRGTAHDAQRVAFLLFCHDFPLARRVIQHGLTLRLAGQFDRDGRQAAALDGDHPFRAALHNLDAHLRLNRYAEPLDIDRWQSVTHAGRLRAGLDYLLPFVLEPELWPWRDGVDRDDETLLRVLLQAVRGYGTGAERYCDALAALPPTQTARREWLLWYPGERGR
ncbi:alginate lyase family protein [Siccibacter colletis]|uniref:alginate lyase family protein n=1 Tax=Siccibacter colletis TaxID=1505757 RepID=UPI0004E1FB60|nr:alginate lyase family protein [Siccibacter colletis]